MASFFSGLAGALLAIFLTPIIQHYFWSRQRLSELRLNAINETNKLMSEYLTNCIAATTNGHEHKPDNEFHKSLMMVDAQIKTLFSATAYTAFKEVESMVGPHSTTAGWPQFGPSHMTVNDFVLAKEKMLASLYEEILPSESLWNFLKLYCHKGGN